MTQQLRRFAIPVLLVTALFVAVVGSRILGALGAGTADEYPPQLAESSFVAIMTVDIVAPVASHLSGTDAWSAVATRQLYERSAYELRDGSVAPPESPAVGEVFEFSSWEQQGVEQGQSYTVGLTRRLFAGGEGEERAWFAVVIVDELTGSPVDGTPESIVDDLAIASFDGAGAIQVVVELAAELESYGRRVMDQADSSVPVEPEGRYAVLRSADQVLAEQHREDMAMAWANQPPERRQLPFDLASVPDGIKAMVGIDDTWRWWIFEITYEPESVQADWVGIDFADVGYIGGSLIDKSERSTGMTTVMGWGPTDKVPGLITWIGGFPAEAVPAGVVPPEGTKLVPRHVASLGSTLEPNGDALGAVAVHVTLKDDGTVGSVELLDTSSYDLLLREHAWVAPPANESNTSTTIR